MCKGVTIPEETDKIGTGVHYRYIHFDPERLGFLFGRIQKFLGRVTTDVAVFLKENRLKRKVFDINVKYPTCCHPSCYKSQQLYSTLL